MQLKSLLTDHHYPFQLAPPPPHTVQKRSLKNSPVGGRNCNQYKEVLGQGESVGHQPGVPPKPSAVHTPSTSVSEMLSVPSVIFPAPKLLTLLCALITQGHWLRNLSHQPSLQGQEGDLWEGKEGGREDGRLTHPVQGQRRDIGGWTILPGPSYSLATYLLGYTLSNLPICMRDPGVCWDAR